MTRKAVRKRRHPKIEGVPVPPSEGLVEADVQAETFAHTRRSHQAEIAEDYVELIADLIDSSGEARTVELANRLGVTHATVNRNIAKLRREGLVAQKPYRAIFLTDAGRQLAEKARRRHQIVLEFLKAIGVNEDVAHIDAEGIEHHVSDETLGAFERFVAEGPGSAGPRGKD